MVAGYVGNFLWSVDKAVWLDILAVGIVRARQIFPIAAHLHNHLGAAFLAGHIGDFLIFRFIFFRFHIGGFQFLGEHVIETAHHLLIGGFAFGDFIQPIFQIGSESHIDDAFEIFLQKLGHFETDVGGDELLAFLGHVAALLDGVENRRIGRRTADALFFQRLDEAGFGISGRRRSEVLFAFRFLVHHQLAFFQRRQEIFFLFLLLRSRTQNGEAREKHVHAGGFQEIISADDGRGGALLNLRRHLGRDEAIPNERVEPHLVAGQHGGKHLGRELEAGGTNGFVSVLRILRLAEHIGLRRQVVAAVGGLDVRTHLLNHFIRNTSGVSTHVRDEPHMADAGDFHAFIEILRQHHGLFRAEIEFIHRILLHGGGGVGRLRLPLLSRFRDGSHVCFFLENPRHTGVRFGLVVNFCVSPLNLGELGFEKFAVLGAVERFHGPIFFRYKGTDFLFPFADEAGRHGLHAAGREPTVHLAPQPGGELVAHQAVQHAASLLRVYAIEVDGFGVGDGVSNGRRGDFVEGDAHIVLRIHIQELRQMPGNRFSFAVRVRCQKDVGALVRCLLQIFDHVRPFRGIHVLRRESILYFYAQRALRQVAKMPHGRHDFIVRSQDALDGFRLGRRLHHHQVLPIGLRFSFEWLLRGLPRFLLDRNRSGDRQWSSSPCI